MTSAPVQDSGAPAPVAEAAARRAALPSLTSLRAFAAAGVFVSHSVFFVGRSDVTRPLFDAGAMGGVSFFFVLSGTILAYNYAGAFSVPRFYRKRFARIYPVYLLAFALGAFIVAAQDRCWRSPRRSSSRRTSSWSRAGFFTASRSRRPRGR